jgi:two-component system, OmpR family, sensor histidine kinase ChvG
MVWDTGIGRCDGPGPWRRPMTRRPPRIAAFSRISVRLLAFNLLLVFIPVAGFLYIDTYEHQLLDAQERAMVQQGRILSAALSGRGPLSSAESRRILRELNQRVEARLRVVDAGGTLLADSARLGPRQEPGSRPASAESAVRANWLYRAGSLLYAIYRRLAPPPEAAPELAEYYGGRTRLMGPEIRAALSGRYGTMTRASGGGQRSVTLYSALPVSDGPRVVGAVLVSQSTFRILQDLYAVRLGILEVFLASIAVAAILSLLVSTTIARPLRALRDEARALVDGRGRLRGSFHGSRKHDEIGDLARSLEELTRRLEAHLRFTESFAADVSHEFKNPLASIRTSTEMLGELDDPIERRRFLEIVQKEVARMERLLSEVREITSIDARLEAEEQSAVDLGPLLSEIVAGFRLRESGRLSFELQSPQETVRVRASRDRLGQVFENVLDNAASFSPDGGLIRVSLESHDGTAVVAIRDEGPGIPPENLERIFERFFSYRPGHPRASSLHTGLGLAIVRTIVEGYGGAIRAESLEGGGARFEVGLKTENASKRGT